MATKRELKALDDHISFWQNKVRDYPKTAVYKRALAIAQAARTKFASKIGKKKSAR